MGTLNNQQTALQKDFKFPTWDQTTWHLMIDNKHPGAGSFTQKTGHITEVARIDWAQSYSAVLGLLGFSYSDGTTLRRVPPIAHPFWNRKYATAITDARGVQFTGKTDYRSVGALPSDADYKFYEVNVNFEPLSMLCPPDNAINPRTGAIFKEWERFTTYEYNFTAQALERQTGDSITWAEGPQAGNNVPNKIFTVERHADIAFTWHCVPEDFVVDISSGSIFPTKLINAVGTVNIDTFANCPAGTLLIKPPIIKRYPSPLICTNNYDSKMYLDITFMLDFFNPTAGVVPSLAAGSAGHQLVPCFKDKVAGVPDKEILYYLVRRGGAAGAAAAIAATNPGGGSAGCIYPFSSIQNLFTHWSV